MSDRNAGAGFGTLLIFSSIWLWNFAIRLVIPALLPTIKAAFGYSTVETGLLISMAPLGIGVSSYVSGILATRIGHRPMIHVSFLLILLAILASTLTNGLHLMAAAFFTIGFGLGAYSPSGVSLLTAAFPASKRGFIFGVHESAATIGLIAGPVLAGLLLASLDWRAPLYAWILIGLPVWFSFHRLRIQPLLVGSSSQTENGAKPDTPEWSPRAPYLAALMFAGMTSIDIGLVSFIPVYLTDIFRLDAAYVAVVFGTSRILGIFTKLASGVASDRFGRLPVLLGVAAGNVILAAATASAPSGLLVIACLFALTTVTSMFYPLIFALVADHAPRRAVGNQIGLVQAVGSLSGTALTPTIIGILTQSFGYGIGFTYPIGIGILGFACTLAMKREIAKGSAASGSKPRPILPH